MANPSWTGPISDLPMDDTGEDRTKRSLNRQADAKDGTDQAFDAFAAYIMSHHFWPVCWRGKSGDNHVMHLMSEITSPQQMRFTVEVVQLNSVIGGKPMSIRQHNQNAFTPKPH